MKYPGSTILIGMVALLLIGAGAVVTLDRFSSIGGNWVTVADEVVDIEGGDINSENEWATVFMNDGSRAQARIEAVSGSQTSVNYIVSAFYVAPSGTKYPEGVPSLNEPVVRRERHEVISSQLSVPCTWDTGIWLNCGRGSATIRLMIEELRPEETPPPTTTVSTQTPVSTEAPIPTESTAPVSLKVPSSVPQVQSKGITAFITDLLGFIKTVLEKLPFTITGPSTVEPGEFVNYNIDITVPAPDHDYTDGTYQTRFGHWALVDSTGKILRESSGDELVGNHFVATANLRIPETGEGEFVFLGVVTEVNSEFDFDTGRWVNGPEVVIAKEGVNIRTKARVLDVVGKPNVVSGGISGVFSFIRDFLGSIFGFVLR
jgi:hypothetical protein